MFFYMLEAAVVVGGIIIFLQLFNVVKVIPEEYMVVIKSLTSRFENKLNGKNIGGDLPNVDATHISDMTEQIGGHQEL